MSLLEDLRGVDLSPITGARDAIRTALASPQLAALTRDGAGRVALAQLGTRFQTLRDAASGDPAALVAPLGDALLALIGHVDLAHLPLGRYTDVVREGALVLARILADFDGDPANLGRIAGAGLGDMLDRAHGSLTQHMRVGQSELGRFKYLVETVERGVPTDPAGFAVLAIEVLLPFPRERVVELRGAATGVVDAAQAITLPAGRGAGLIAALDAIRAAAVAGDRAAVDRAAAELDRVRRHTIEQLRNDLFAAATRIDRLDVGGTVAVVTRSREWLQGVDEGTLEILQRVRQDLAGARTLVENLPVERFVALIPRVVDAVDGRIRAAIFEPIDRQVLRARDFVRSVFRRLPLRALRAEVTAFLAGLARRIQDAKLDAPARFVRGLLTDVRGALSSSGLAAEIQAALQDVKAAIDGALDEVVAALELVGDAIESVAGEARGILERAAAALRSFSSVVDRVDRAIDRAGLAEAGARVAKTLADIRETASKLLTIAPLPDSLRKQVRQLVDVLERVDLDATLFRPIRAAAAELHVPDAVRESAIEALRRVGEVIANLIPAELVAGVEAEVRSTLDQIAKLDPAALTATLREYLDEAAQFVERLSPSTELADRLQEPYERVLAVFDEVDPRKLLEPVARAYDDILGKIPLPEPETMARRVSDLMNIGGDRMARALTEPARRLAPSDGAAQPPASPTIATPAAPAIPPDPGQTMPGDLVRMIGYLPRKLREALAALPLDRATGVVAAVHDLCGGLSVALRAIAPALDDVERRIDRWIENTLAPLGGKRFDALSAVRGAFPADRTALDLLTQTGPRELRDAIQDARATALARARDARQGLGAAGGALHRAAAQLEGSALAKIGQDLDAFLAAIDPEPIAAELDALIIAAIDRAPDLIESVKTELMNGVARVRSLLGELSLTSLAQRFEPVVAALREELQLLDPRRLADELGGVHQAIRDTLAAYEPTVFVEELRGIVAAVALQLRSLDPAALVGDLSFLSGTLARVEAAMPSRALQGVGAALADVGAELAALDVNHMLDRLESLAPRTIDQAEFAIEATRREVVSLLRTLSAAGGANA